MNKLIIERDGRLFDHIKFPFNVQDSLFSLSYEELSNFALIDSLVNTIMATMNYIDNIDTKKTVISNQDENEYLIWSIVITNNNDYFDYDIIDWNGSNKKMKYMLDKY